MQNTETPFGKSRTQKTTKMLLTALFAALTGISAVIAIPMAPVPVSLATLAVILSGGLLGAKYGTLSQVVYLALGTAGVPIFHSFTSGAGILLGPTGGYLAGYIVMAFLIGLLVEKRPASAKGGCCSYVYTVLAIVLATFVLYALGTLYFMLLTGSSLWPALIACVFPFLPGDALKILAGTILIEKLRPRLRIYT